MWDERKEQQYLNTRVVKNKVSGPWQEANDILLVHDEGINRIDDLFNVAKKKGILGSKAGGNYSYKDYKWRGKPALVEALNNDDKLAKEIEKEVRND